jgi:serine/threonine protein kinase
MQQFESLIKKEKIELYYTLDESNLGTGGFAVVKKGYLKSTNQPYAIKIFKKNVMEQEDEVSLENEVTIMSQVR